MRDSFLINYDMFHLQTYPKEELSYEKSGGLKKVLNFFLALTMVFSMLPVNALAQNIEDGEEVQGKTYQENDTIWLPAGEELSHESYPLGM